MLSVKNTIQNIFPEEFQKLHNELHELFKNGKFEEMDKYFFDESVVINPIHDPMTIAGKML